MFLQSNGDLNGSVSGGSSELTFADAAHNKLKKNRHKPKVRLDNGSPFAGGDFITNRHSGEFLLEQGMDSSPSVGGRPAHSVAMMERELKASIARLYQNYDFVTDEYDRLYEIVDKLREDYNNSKNLLFYNRYKEFRRMIKNSLRQWRSVEKRSTLAMSRKTSNNNYMAMSSSLPRGQMPGGGRGGNTTSLASIDEGGSFTNNLDARLKAQHNPATRELYAECTRLEREIFQYKSRNQIIKNLLCKLAESYENSKAHVLHIWGRFKELRSMIKEVIDSDV